MERWQMENPTSHRSVIPIALARNSYLCAWAHLCWANDSHDGHIRPHTRSVAYARGDDLEGRWHADKNRLPG